MPRTPWLEGDGTAGAVESWGLGGGARLWGLVVGPLGNAVRATSGSRTAWGGSGWANALGGGGQGVSGYLRACMTRSTVG
jgi:hypothetical protein